MIRKALVLGSEGNIGVPLVRHLRSRGVQVLEADIRPGWRDAYLMADINHPVDLLPAFDWGPDTVFLLSAMVSRVTCEQASGLAIATNLGGVNNVLQLAKRSNAQVVFFSTSEVYGPECDPMDEGISNPRPNNRYGLSKLLGEQLVEYEARTHGLKAVVLRPFMMYDENEDLGDHRSAMIRFTSDLALGRPIEVHRGSARSWLHVSDAIRAIEAAASVEQYSVINIGHPDVAPIADLAEMIRATLGADPELVRIKDLPSRMTLVKRPSLTRMRELLGVDPAVSLREGVRLVCARVQARLKAGERPLSQAYEN
jgi:nucleoside-diphosphate-sugar epimerase